MDGCAAKEWEECIGWKREERRGDEKGRGQMGEGVDKQDWGGGGLGKGETHT